MGESYFQGDKELTLEHTFYELGNEPVLFVCKDKSEKRFLCSCYQLDQGWVIGQVDDKVLISLMDDKITIREVFEQHCDPKWNLTWNGERFNADSEVPSDILPRKGALLELGPRKIKQYRDLLWYMLQGN